ncbi:MAG: hypothetical protein ACFFCI_12035 [Promethearchaeota archaeon]
MAKFIQDPNISLDRNFKKNYVLVEGIAPMKFEEHEIGSKWEFKVDIMDNNIIVGSVTKVFKPKKLEVNEKFKEKIDGAKFKKRFIDMKLEYKYFINHLD